MISIVLQPEEGETWNLVALTPEYLESEHAGYVRAIEAALSNDQIRNIALSGNFGVGKSSILQEVARRQKGRVVELSLSTLAPIEASRLDESVPVQATTPTNRIQQEIVKQLLYREEPGKARGSRFRRIERFRWRRELATATLLGLVVAVVFLLTGWSAQIASVFAPLLDLGLWVHPLVWALSTAVVLLIRHLFYGQFHIKQFSAASATVTLDDKSVSYFDQYLDEIVYFFDVSEQDIVIFEDIDRFNDSHIFETLRSLNTLLNASPQVDKPVRFIYAIKDSIFDRIGLEEEGRKLEPYLLAIEDPARAEAVRANRTKFFDLVIPVVPFITHRSARNLAVQLLGEIKHEVAPELLDLATQYVPDMRLLKNVRNEFVVFRDRIFSGEGKQLKLRETHLFAMMLYKSTHLTDFEAIRIGKSNLDTLYNVSRNLVTENIKRIERERRVTRQRLVRVNGVATRSEHLGDRLLAHVRRTIQAAGYQEHTAAYSFAGKARSLEDLKSAQFWTEFVSADGNPPLQWRNNNYAQQLSFTRENLAPALGDPLDTESWDEADREALKEQIAEQTERLKFLRSADLGDLIKRPDFLVEHEGTEQSFEAVAHVLLTPGLAFQLVRAGYINRSFTLYTSTFHGDRVSPAATNFIIHHVERDSMDEHFELDADDVDAVVRERGKDALKEPALYNIAILDRLLQADVDAADIMIRSFVGFDENQTRFMQAYLGSGAERARFIERFTRFSSRILIYLVSEVDLDDPARLELVSVALAHLAERTKYRTDSAVSSYLMDHYAELVTLTSETIEPSQAERIADLFGECGVTLPLLKPLTENARHSFVARNLYEIGRENLELAIGSTTSLALDQIRNADQTVYDYVLGNLGAYLAAVEGVSPTVEASERFISVIEDVLGRDVAQLGEVIKRASAECTVTDLSEVADGAWPALAEHERLAATFDNVSRYIDTVGALDANVAKVLTSVGSITETRAAGEEAKTTLARTILAARDTLPSAGLRAQLVASLELRNYLSVGDIEAENGELFALLLKHDIIADDSATYAHLAGTDWPTREAFISESTIFKDYVTPAHVQGDLAALLLSEKVDTAIKTVIVEHAHEYVSGAGPKDLRELARFATQHGHQLTQDVVQRMALGGVAAQHVVILLEPHLASLAPNQLFQILQSLGGDYPKLTTLGRDKPKIPNTSADRALLERLKQHGIVNSYDDHASPIKVNKKHK